MKIGVHFNCQHDGLAASLRALLPQAEVISYHSATSLPVQVQAERAAVLNGCDHVIISQADARHGLLSTDALRRSTRQCHLLPPFGFAGYHPDMCYVHANGQEVDSCTGGYHSRIAVAAYLAGLGARDTVALYNRLVFSRLGYFAAFEEQVALLCQCWAREGIDMQPRLRQWAASGCFVHSINHPKIAVLLDIARIACTLMGVTPANPDIDPAALPDRLARGSMHPVFPEIAAALGIAPEGCFSGGYLNDAPVVFTPLAFVGDSFGRYADVPTDALRATPGLAEAMAALGLSVRAQPPRRLGNAMVLLTHHGTLLRQGPSRGEVSHAPLATADWQAAYLRLDCTRLPARQASAGIEEASLAVAADKRRLVISRAGAFLSADPSAGRAGFTGQTAGAWEHFLPLSEEELALLHRLAAADWFVEDMQQVVTRPQIGIEAGPSLRFGQARIDLARHFPVAAGNGIRLVLEGVGMHVHEHAPRAPAAIILPEPGRTLGLVGPPVFVRPPAVADAADLQWMRRSAVAALALDGAAQATQALLRREASAPGALTVRFCVPGPVTASGWADAAARLHVLDAVAPSDAAFLVPPEIDAQALQGWQALGFAARLRQPGAFSADVLWLDNASIAELPVEALAGCRARAGVRPGAGRRLFWQAGVAPSAAAQGFEDVDAGRLSVIEAVALAAGAAWIIGRTGRMPLLFCREGTRVIELCDEAGFVQDDWVLSSKLGLRHAILPCAAPGGVLAPDAGKLARLIATMADMP